MRVILKNQVESYRFTVAKIIFLLTEPKYEFILDVEDSNIMSVYDTEKDERIYISIFGKPTNKNLDEYPIHIYYQKPSYKRYIKNNKKEDNKIRVHQLSADFDEYFSSAIENSFYDTTTFFERLPNKYHELFDCYFLRAENRLYEELKIDKLHKYYSKEAIVNNNHRINDGALSFSHPKYFNDPFDCNCMLANNQDMSDKFRVLCLTHEHDNILMWSYYSENHTGYCFEFLFNDLIREINKLPIKGLCVYGNLKYDSKRPEQKSQVNYFSFTDLNFYIDAVFTKYSEWEHEKESRFVIISPYSKDDFISLSLKINKIYEGCEGNGEKIYDSSKNILTVSRLFKDDINYELK